MSTAKQKLRVGDKIEIAYEVFGRKKTFPWIGFDFWEERKVAEVSEIQEYSGQYHDFVLVSLKVDGIYWGTKSIKEVVDMMRRANPDLFVKKLKEIEI